MTSHITVTLSLDAGFFAEDAAAAGFAGETAETDYLRHVLVRALYDLGALSSGKAAESLGISRVGFLSQYGMSAASMHDQANEVLGEYIRRVDGEEPEAAAPSDNP